MGIKSALIPWDYPEYVHSKCLVSTLFSVKVSCYFYYNANFLQPFFVYDYYIYIYYNLFVYMITIYKYIKGRKNFYWVKPAYATMWVFRFLASCIRTGKIKGIFWVLDIKRYQKEAILDLYFYILLNMGNISLSESHPNWQWKKTLQLWFL